jgi:hypothetical protein
MRTMTQRLDAEPAEDPAAGASLRRSYARAHRDYLCRRQAIADVPEIAGVSAGGMPRRVKCLHVLVGHALAAGRGVNPLGDEAIDALPAWWAAGPCVQVPPDPPTPDQLAPHRPTPDPEEQP